MNVRLIILLLSFAPFYLSGQIITTVAGGGSSGIGDGGPATAADIGIVASIAFDNLGNLYIADGNHHRIRKVDLTNGVVTTIAGTGIAGYLGDGGSATEAQLNSAHYLTLDAHNNIFISDVANRRVRKISSSSGIISTVAGNGTMGYSGDGNPATNASFITAQGLIVDTSGNIYITDLGARVVRKVNTGGIISTYAGNGLIGFSGDGGLATNCQLNNPQGVALDSSGNLYIADYNNNRIRKIDNISSVIMSVAGNGVGGYIGDGMDALSTRLNGPFSVTLDANKNIYIADFVNDRIRKIDIATGLISTVAGNGSTGFSGDGAVATAASLNRPAGVAFDPCGNLYIADNQNRRIRKVTFNPITTPTIAITSTSTAAIGTTVTVNATVTGAGSAYTIKWFKNTALFSTTTAPITTYTKGEGTDVITARVVPTVSYCYDSAMSSAHTISETVGVTNAYASSVSVYPNPAYTQLVIVAADPIREIVVTNLLGQAVEAPAMPHGKKAVVQVSHLPTGMYLLKVNDAWVHRFYKE